MRALTVIRDEHRALASVMKGLEYLMDQFRQGLLVPDFALLRALVQYIEQYPDKLHHPKEDGYLFPTLRERDGSAAATLGSAVNALPREMITTTCHVGTTAGL